uniref:Uncharacterized protein n=1 Tax=Timema poppense TaxID=170557 RepID=A0A7R9H9B0_TIMPO|nr:unnamed protein product [Timema poppensis]
MANCLSYSLMVGTTVVAHRSVQTPCCNVTYSMALGTRNTVQRNGEKRNKHLYPSKSIKLLSHDTCLDYKSSSYSSPMASLVLSDGFEKLPDQIMYTYAEPYDLQKHVFSSSHF